MAWSLFLTRRAEKDLRRLSEEDAGRIVDALKRFASDGHGDVRRLKDIDPPEWRLRVGDIRARFSYRPEEKELIVLRIVPRGKAY